MCQCERKFSRAVDSFCRGNDSRSWNVCLFLCQDPPPPSHWLSSWPGPYNYRENIDSSMTFLPPDASTEYTVYSSTSVSNNCTQQACIVCISERMYVCTEALIRGLERCSEDCALLFSILASRPSSLLSVSIRFRGARLLHSPLSSLPHQH